jgi:hypothetical protein
MSWWVEAPLTTRHGIGVPTAAPATGASIFGQSAAPAATPGLFGAAPAAQQAWRPVTRVHSESQQVALCVKRARRCHASVPASSPHAGTRLARARGGCKRVDTGTLNAMPLHMLGRPRLGAFLLSLRHLQLPSLPPATARSRWCAVSRARLESCRFGPRHPQDDALRALSKLAAAYNPGSTDYRFQVRAPQQRCVARCEPRRRSIVAVLPAEVVLCRNSCLSPFPRHCSAVP